MREVIQNWWANHSVGETATLAFWNLALVAFIGGAAWMAKGIIQNYTGPDCAETFRVTDPRLNAILFATRMEKRYSKTCNCRSQKPKSHKPNRPLMSRILDPPTWRVFWFSA
jgi:hypothetical protein